MPTEDHTQLLIISDLMAVHLQVLIMKTDESSRSLY